MQGEQYARGGGGGGKDNWFQRKALETQRSRFVGKAVWRCVRDIQRRRRGLVPVRSAVVRGEEGNTCSTPEQQQQRWRSHFSRTLNIHSEFDEEEIGELDRGRCVLVCLRYHRGGAGDGDRKVEEWKGRECFWHPS